MTTLREQLYERMRELGYRQVELSERIGCKVQNLNSYFKGKRAIPFECLEKMCDVLGLTLVPVN